MKGGETLRCDANRFSSTCSGLADSGGASSRTPRIGPGSGASRATGDVLAESFRMGPAVENVPKRRLPSCEAVSCSARRSVSNASAGQVARQRSALDNSRSLVSTLSHRTAVADAGQKIAEGHGALGVP